MSCQRQEGDSLLAEWISVISKLFVRFMSWHWSSETQCWRRRFIRPCGTYRSQRAWCSKSDYGFCAWICLL